MLNILNVSTADIGGGAEKVAYTLFSKYKERGHISKLIVGNKVSKDEDIICFPYQSSTMPWTYTWDRIYMKLLPLGERRHFWKAALKMLNFLLGGWPEYTRLLGWENFNFPSSHRLLSLLDKPPDIIHFHNLHGNYFDLRYLPVLSNSKPVVITLHDEWLFTGHCAYTMGCERWRKGCGKCPDISIYPAVYQDATSWNWRRKERLYGKSNLFVASPSNWLLNRVEKSILHPYQSKIIPYGVELNTFCPVKNLDANRKELNIPENTYVLLFCGNHASKSPFKDYQTVENAVTQLEGKNVLLITLGGNSNLEKRGTVTIRHVPYESNSSMLAKYYQSADIFLHAAHADNFPNTILESLASGVPVITTAVGGIPEQVQDGSTGFLVPSHDYKAMAEKINVLLSNRDLRLRMAGNARKRAEKYYDLEVQVDKYLDWYHMILEEQNQIRD